MTEQNETTSLAPLDQTSIEPETPIEQVAQVLDRLEAYMSRARELKKYIDEQVICWLEANGGAITIGTVEYRLGQRKENKVIDLAAAVEALLQACGGDMQAFVQCLSANALKPGACRQVLGQAWDDHFKVEVKVVLENDRAKKELIKTDTKWLK